MAGDNDERIRHDHKLVSLLQLLVVVFLVAFLEISRDPDWTSFATN